ncbi:MAG TPA: hypothetical protein VN969_24415 [Streptosporangiaceae bacterium]|jgi:hypothetical protein|nr:hypothetical protein [Streptosporangiaceae bacterium]
MSTQISGDFGITHVFLESKVRLIVGGMSFALTVAWEAGGVWRYTLSLVSDTTRNSRAGYGRVLAPDYRTAAIRAAEQLAQGYEPGTIERGLLDALAQGQVSDPINALT